ncbi:MAG TPA: CbiX/SirB N-terminal domain-containing protein [Pirellulaceae bacterium]|nr:CbiX/SirB N-terminal domain-containing protein [Pirellulaceae bacterium]
MPDSSDNPDPLVPLDFDAERLAAIVVDHGSRRAESNQALLDVVARFRETSPIEIVEPAHMELAEPSIETAFARCVEQGATLIVVHPFFLLPGRHWRHDIPRLAAEAAAKRPGVRFLVTAPLGLHAGMGQIMQEQIDRCLAHAAGRREACDLCRGLDACAWRAGG